MDNENYMAIIGADKESRFEVDTSQPPPVIEDYDTAEEVVSKVILDGETIKGIQAKRDFIIAQANLWADQKIKQIENYNNWYSSRLIDFMRAINKSDPKKKSIKFPLGKIGFRQSPEKIEIDPDYNPAEHTDDPNVVVKTTYSVSKTAIKNQMEATGELPDYASVVPGEIKFYIKPLTKEIEYWPINLNSNR